MKTKKNDFLFYTDWNDFVTGSAAALAGRLAAFATEFGLSGHVWQQWLTYILMMHDNAFTMACERREVLPDSTLMKLAERDLGIFMELFRAGDEDFDEDEKVLTLMLDYKAPYDGDCISDAGKRIEELSFCRGCKRICTRPDGLLQQMRLGHLRPVQSFQGGSVGGRGRTEAGACY